MKCPINRDRIQSLGKGQHGPKAGAQERHGGVDRVTWSQPAPEMGLIPRILPGAEIQLSPEQRGQIARQKATCPFVGSLVHQGELAVRHQAERPLASIEDIRRLGNTGGGDLGDLLALFASGNHACMKGEGGRLDVPVAAGLFSLDFPGSQGSHPGHSGILQGDPHTLDSGRFSAADFDRLAGRAHGGLLKRSDVGEFIAENLRRDPESKVFGLNVAGSLLHDVLDLVKSTGPALLAKLTGSPRESQEAHRELEIRLTRLLGENNLVGSAGEFGLMFALLVNRPGAQEVDGEPCLRLADVKTMMVDQQLPEGWQNWKKTRLSWVSNTTGLLLSAARAYAGS